MFVHVGCHPTIAAGNLGSAIRLPNKSCQCYFKIEWVSSSPANSFMNRITSIFSGAGRYAQSIEQLIIRSFKETEQTSVKMDSALPNVNRSGIQYHFLAPGCHMY